MATLLQELVGQRVQVYSVRGETEVSDSGTLEAFDDHWLKLKQDQDILYFSISRVRLIKPL